MTSRPEDRPDRIVVEVPPQTSSDGAAGLVANAVPMLGSLGSVAYLVTTTPGSTAMIGAGLFLCASIGFVVANGWRQRSHREESAERVRTRYLEYLAALRTQVLGAASRQRRSAVEDFPDPQDLPHLVDVWGPRWDDSDRADPQGRVRVGVGERALCVALAQADPGPLAHPDALLVAAAERFVATHSTQPDLPVDVDLLRCENVEITGSAAVRRSLARALVLSAAFRHAPRQLQVVILVDAASAPAWEWAKWLPHCAGASSDAVGPVPLVGFSWEMIEPFLDRSVSGAGQRHTLVVCDAADSRAGAVSGQAATVVFVGSAPPTRPPTLRLRADVSRSGLGLDLSGPDVASEVVRTVVRPPVRPPVRPDQVSVPVAEAAARRMAGHHARRSVSRSGSRADVDVAKLLGLGEVTSGNLAVAWAVRPRSERLRATLGTGEAGEPIVLDLKQPAEGGVGPHGLLIGATGSGKSELLRTLVLSLVAHHGPDVLNLVLVDFKGGATFAGLSDLPHVAAFITNLMSERTLVERMEAALRGEVVRRQEVLRAAGNLTSVVDYDTVRGPGQPLPDLLVICDEFSELLSTRPELLDLFVTIGRVGRSLGIHLLLASQRLEEGRLRGLDAHLSYRLGLRTFSAAESRALLGVPDAAELPSVPGAGYLRTDPSTLLRLTAAYVSGPAVPDPTREAGEPRETSEILPFPAMPCVERPGDRRERPTPGALSLLDLAVVAMAGHGVRAHQVWLPPLDRPDTLGVLMPDLAVVPGRGLVSEQWRFRGPLVVPVGQVDRPFDQTREPLVVDLGGAAGHAAFIGGPRSGRSTLTRTLICALALTTSPRDLQVFVLDFGGGTFAELADLPHVSGVATRGEPDVVRRVVAEVQTIARAREDHFREAGIVDIDDYRGRLATGERGDGYGDVVLVVDGWGTIRSDFDDLEPVIQDLAGRGLTYGVHLVATASRWLDVRTQLKDLFGTRIELRLGEPAESEVDRLLAESVPSGRAGRGLTTSRHHVLVALPRIDGDGDPATLGVGLADLVDQVRSAWPGPDAPRLRMLPERVPLETLAQQGGTDQRLILGLDEAQLAPIGVDLAVEPHLLLFGDPGSGKTTVLRTYVAQILGRHTPDRAQVVLVDPRRSMLAEVPSAYLTGYWSTRAQIGDEVAALAAYLATRLPGPEVTAAQLRSGTWWSGPEVFVLVDDYDLLTTSGATPLAPLVPLLAQARDIGLHVVLARRCGGASRALHDPVIQGLRDSSAAALVLSGSPQEGPLVGIVRPRPFPPGRGVLVTRSADTVVVQVALKVRDDVVVERGGLG